MKNKFILLVILSAFLSCKETRKAESSAMVPLVESKSSDFVSKRYDKDLVDDLYENLAEQNLSLKQLDKKIADLHRNKLDSQQSFNTFNEKNISFYEAATAHAKEIRDTVLRKKANLMITEGMHRYSMRIKQQKLVIADIEEKTKVLNDLYEYLKVTKTLPIISNIKRTGQSQPRNLWLTI